MLISATELKQNLGHWMEVSAEEDVYVQKKGRLVTKLTNPYRDKLAELDSLVGIIPADFDAEEALDNRRSSL